MILPKDPYEITTERMIEEAEDALEKVDAEIKNLYERQTQLNARIAAHNMTLQAYKESPPSASKNGSDGPYADDSTLVKLLKGISLWQKLVVLGLINDRSVSLTPAGRVMHRIGAMGGSRKNVNGRLYTEVGNHIDVFEWSAPGEYKILPGAERHLPLSTRSLLKGARLNAVGGPTIT